VRWSFATIVLVPRGQWSPPPDAAARQRLWRWAAQSGFEGVELSPRWFDFDLLSNTELSQLCAEIEAEGLLVSGLNISRCILTRTQVREHVDRLWRAVEVASTLRAPVVTVSLSMPKPPTADRPLLRGDQIPEVERAATATLLADLACFVGLVRGVQLSLELHDDGLLDTPELLLDMLKRVDAPNVGVNPDLGNFCRTSDEPADWRAALQALAPHANCWHVKNYRRGEPAKLWEGDIDYAEAMAIMRAHGYTGWVSIEGYQGDVLSSQEESLAYLKQLAGK
jgi:sugar phosphate isomerase/epimerase